MVTRAPHSHTLAAAAVLAEWCGAAEWWETTGTNRVRMGAGGGGLPSLSTNSHDGPPPGDRLLSLLSLRLEVGIDSLL